MKLVFGLGNPGAEYAGTRHNAGFEAVMAVARDNGIRINKSKRRALVGEGVVRAQKCLLAMPLTYMNLSGEAVRGLMEFYKADISDIIVVYDDTALDVGEIRVRERGSAGGHNGMADIILKLGTDEFTRVRIGVGAKPPEWELKEYVLSRFRKDEMDAFVSGVGKAAAAVGLIIKEGAEAAMNRYNSRKSTKEINGD